MRVSKSILFLLSFLIFTTSNARNNTASMQQQKNAVVSKYSGGRFGDNILAIAHTLYFARKNKFEFFLKPFPYSDQLILDNRLPKYSPTMKSLFKKVTTLTSGQVVVDGSIKSTLFIVPYFPEAPIERVGWNKPILLVNWEDKRFKHELRTLIAPKTYLSLVKPPKDKISVAVHIRSGVDFDNWTEEERFLRVLLTYKAPLDGYYINQIKTIAEMFRGIPLYIFLFTDDPNPQALANKYKEQINIPTLEFDYRREGNHHTANVLEDFFSLMQFDVLIRSESSFSIMAEKLGDHSIVVSPGEFLPNLRIQEGLVTRKKPLALTR